MVAYLLTMTSRPVELCRVLKTTGSIYLHCDPTAAELLAGNEFDIPYAPSMYQPAQRVQRPEGRQATMDDTV